MRFNILQILLILSYFPCFSLLFKRIVSTYQLTLGWAA